MPKAVPEFQFTLSRLAQQLEHRAHSLVSRMARLTQREALSFITDAYPELALPFITSAIQLAVQWYDEQPAPMGTVFVPRPAPPPADEQLATSGRWAMTQDDPAAALGGTSTRVVFNGARDTVLANVEAEPGTRWARYASANACSFCRLMATKGAVYLSAASATSVVGRTPKAGKEYSGQTRGSRELGQPWHDNCHCIAVPVRPGDIYHAPPYVGQWEQDYKAAVKDARAVKREKGERGAPTLTDIVNAMDRAQRAKIGAQRGRPAKTSAN